MYLSKSRSFHAIVVWTLLEVGGAPTSHAFGSVPCSLCSFSMPDIPKHHFHWKAAAGEGSKVGVPSSLHAPWLCSSSSSCSGNFVEWKRGSEKEENLFCPSYRLKVFPVGLVPTVGFGVVEFHFPGLWVDMS